MKVFILTRKRLTVIAAALALLVCVGIFRSAGSEKAVAANAGERRIPIYSVDTQEKKVSISFDAAWGNEQTGTLLDILDKYKVKATFFLVGDWVRKYPDDVKAIAKAGHDVGNHSNTHPYMTQIGIDEMQKEIQTCNKDIENLIGKKPTLFRPPYGDYDNNVVDAVNSLGMYCIQWDVDSLDWKGLSKEEMCSRIKNNLQSGSIVLMHNGGENTPDALPSIIETIKEMGYEIVPISELLLKGDYTTDHTGKMIGKSDDTSTKEESSETAKPAAATIAASSSKAVAAVSSKQASSVPKQGVKGMFDDMIADDNKKK